MPTMSQKLRIASAAPSPRMVHSSKPELVRASESPSPPEFEVMQTLVGEHFQLPDRRDVSYSSLFFLYNN
jgi:hypothetical protein